MSKNSILPIHIGGTIASAESSTGFKPKLSFTDLLDEIDQGLSGERHIAIAQSPFGEFGIDSASMQIPHIQKIARTIWDNYNTHDGFIVTHGTDTLAYTASMLSFMLQGVQKPVIVTGAQRTLEDDQNDVIRNLETSLLAASTSNSGVWVAFNEKIIRAVRATKINIGVDCVDAFASNIKDEIPLTDFQRNDYSVKPGHPETFDTDASEALDIYCLSHTTKPDLLRKYLEYSELNALIVIIYGMSGHRKELMEVLSGWARENGAIVIAKTHSPYGSTDLSKYELGITALQMGVLSSLDMTLESVYAKASTLLARCGTTGEFTTQFYSNFCGELDEGGVQKFRKKAAFWFSAS